MKGPAPRTRVLALALALLQAGATGALAAAAAPAPPPAHGKTRKPAATRHTTKKAAPAAPAPASVVLDPADAVRQREEEARQHQQLLDQLDTLKKEIAAGEASRSEAADALASSERAISDSNRKLHDLAQQKASVEAQRAVLESHRAELAAASGTQKARLAQLVAAEYRGGTPDAIRLILAGDSPAQLQRDLVYAGYVSAAQVRLIQSYNDGLAALRAAASQIEARDAELAGIAAQATDERAALVKEETARRATLTALSTKLAAQRAQAGQLERDEKRLSQVVTELSRLIERQEKERREARERERLRASQKEKQETESRSGAPGSATVASGGSTAPAKHGAPPAPEPVFEGSLAALRGRLNLPVAGSIVGRFGATRPEGGPAWKGLFIRAQAGAEVRAVAPGRVVFAEWLRGFGNLIIVDHGDQYLSIYGNNESLLKQPGDKVSANEVIATVGNSGGNPETGLYFEMRYQGKPIDPLNWMAAH